jgi:hypothetical protein
MDTLNISTGAKRIPIVRDGQSVGEIAFNPSDVVFAEKFYRLIAEFQKAFTQYQVKARALESNTAVDANGLPANLSEQIELTKEACTFAYSHIDVLFGAGTSAMVFGDTYSPDAILQFFSGMTPFVQAARTEKVAKYTNKKPSRK